MDIKLASSEHFNVYNGGLSSEYKTAQGTGMLPNILYKLGTLTGTISFVMASAPNSAMTNEWYWTFETSSTSPTITWPAQITSWNGGTAPEINSNMHYEISVLDGVGAFMEVELNV